MFQQTTLVGRMGRDAEKKEVNSQKLVEFSIAVDNGYYDQSGEWIDRTNWYNCALWRDAKIDRLKKGAIVFVQGFLAPRIYTNHAGQPTIDLSLRVDTYRILHKAPEEQAQHNPVTTDNKMTDPEPKISGIGESDDLPF